jgi:Do/DeqQ family serine protease
MNRKINDLLLGMLGGGVILAIYLLVASSNKPQGDFVNGQAVRTSVQPDMPSIHQASLAAMPTQLSFIESAENSVNAVVHIRTEMRTRTSTYDDFFGSLREYLYGNPFYGNQQKVVGFGSGVVLSSDGYIVTNNHVVEGADKIEVTFNDKRKMVAELVGSDPMTDIALIKVEANGLPFLVFGNSDELKVGEWVLAVGNPFNLTSTVTAGIVSAKARNINILGNRSSIDSFIQTDAVINRGNSGGALVNTSGQLIGINAAIASRTGVYEGYSFAIPGNIVRKIVDDIIRFGEPQRAFIGVEIREMDEELATKSGEESIKGVYVARVTENGAAAEAGIKSGDVILEINKRPVNSLSQLLEAVGQYRPGDVVELLTLRNGNTREVKVKLRNQDGTTQVVTREPTFFSKDLGASLARLSQSEKSELNINAGLRVTDVREGVLRRGGIGKDFIILQVNGSPVDSREELDAALSKSRSRTIRVQGMYPNGMRISFEFVR